MCGASTTILKEFKWDHDIRVHEQYHPVLPRIEEQGHSAKAKRYSFRPKGKIPLDDEAFYTETKFHSPEMMKTNLAVLENLE